MSVIGSHVRPPVRKINGLGRRASPVIVRLWLGRRTYGLHSSLLSWVPNTMKSSLLYGRVGDFGDAVTDEAPYLSKDFFNLIEIDANTSWRAAVSSLQAPETR